MDRTMSNNKETTNISKFNELEQRVIAWSHDKGIFKHSDPTYQLKKTQEELDETAEAVRRGTLEDVKDGYGDMLVTIINGMYFYGLTAEECLEHSLSIIEKRTGKMIGGIFVKDEDES